MNLNCVLFASLLIANLIIHSEGFCLGLLCGVVPLASKLCCKVKRKCCVQYQAWLAPLIGTNDVLHEYVDAVTNELFDETREHRIDRDFPRDSRSLELDYYV